MKVTDQSPVIEHASERTAVTRAETKAATRAKLLEAAKSEILGVGYRSATLDGIAAKAGFTKGAVYWHFPNKQAVFLALVSESIDTNFAALGRIIQGAGGDPDRLRSAIGEYIDGIDRNESLPAFGVELEIEARSDPSFRALHQNLIHKHEVALTAFLERYFAAVGERPPMPVAELSATLIALFKGFALSHQNRSDMPVTSAKAVRHLLGLPL